VLLTPEGTCNGGLLPPGTATGIDFDVFFTGGLPAAGLLAGTHWHGCRVACAPASQGDHLLIIVLASRLRLFCVLLTWVQGFRGLVADAGWIGEELGIHARKQQAGGLLLDLGKT
jgi:hypothetical protein